MAPSLQTSNVLARHRFVWLLGALLGLFALLPIFHELQQEEGSPIPALGVCVFFAIVLGVVVSSIVENPWLKGFATVVGLLAVGLWVLPSASATTEVFRHLFAVAFLLYAIVMMLRVIFAARRGTFDLICASLCVYMLLGVVWALAYSMIEIQNPGAFILDGQAATSLRMGAGRSTAGLYFSFTTLTTLGYGDIVPRSPIARMLATLEAVVGQLYLTVLVARLVGMHLAEEESQRNS